MKIVYATVLEGLDRITRSLEILRYLKKKHDLFVIASGRAYGTIEEEFDRHFRIDQPPPYLEDEEAQENYLWEHNGMLMRLLKGFQPDCLILDGEKFGSRLAKKLQLPVLSVDAMQFLDRSHLDLPIPSEKFESFTQLRKELRRRKEYAHWYLLPLFFSPTPTKGKTLLAPPLLRSEVIEIPPSTEEKFLAYHWSGLDENLYLFNELDKQITVHVPVTRYRKKKETLLWEKEVANENGRVLKRRRKILPKELNDEEIEAQLPDPMPPNVHFVPASPELWGQDLARAQAVILQGEHTSIAEAIYQKKPLLLIPNLNRFDQWIYAQYVEKMGFGETHPRLTRTILEGFLERLPTYQQNLNHYFPQGNEHFFQLLDHLFKTKFQPHKKNTSHKHQHPRKKNFSSPKKRKFSPQKRTSASPKSRKTTTRNKKTQK